MAHHNNSRHSQPMAAGTPLRGAHALNVRPLKTTVEITLGAIQIVEYLPYMGLALLVAIAPLAIAIYFLITIWKIRRYGPFIFFGLLASAAYIVVTAVFPPDTFYIDELKYYTNIQIPSEKITVITGESTYPDMHGDYYMRATFRIRDFDIVSMAKTAGLKPCSFSQPTAEQDLICWSSDSISNNFMLQFNSKNNTLELTHMP